MSKLLQKAFGSSPHEVFHSWYALDIYARLLYMQLYVQGQFLTVQYAAYSHAGLDGGAGLKENQACTLTSVFTVNSDETSPYHVLS